MTSYPLLLMLRHQRKQRQLINQVTRVDNLAQFLAIPEVSSSSLLKLLIYFYFQAALAFGSYVEKIFQV
jgi:hypothetical protein